MHPSCHLESQRCILPAAAAAAAAAEKMPGRHGAGNQHPAAADMPAHPLRRRHLHWNHPFAAMSPPGLGAPQGAAGASPDGRSPAGSQLDGSSPKYSQNGEAPDRGGALAAHSSVSDLQEPPHELPPHVARLTRQSVELIEQARRSCFHTLPPSCRRRRSCRPKRRCPRGAHLHTLERLHAYQLCPSLAPKPLLQQAERLEQHKVAPPPERKPARPLKVRALLVADALTRSNLGPGAAFRAAAHTHASARAPRRPWPSICGCWPSWAASLGSSSPARAASTCRSRWRGCTPPTACCHS